MFYPEKTEDNPEYNEHPAFLIYGYSPRIKKKFCFVTDFMHIGLRLGSTGAPIFLIHESPKIVSLVSTINQLINFVSGKIGEKINKTISPPVLSYPI